MTRWRHNVPQKYKGSAFGPAQACSAIRPAFRDSWKKTRIIVVTTVHTDSLACAGYGPCVPKEETRRN
eukprot:59467-Ditylum_brightwellii.AAC.1